MCEVSKNLVVSNTSYLFTKAAKEEFIKVVAKRGLNMTIVANKLGVSSSRLSNIISGRVSFSEKVKHKIDLFIGGLL